MVSIALVSGRLVGANSNVAVKLALEEKGHTVTFFNQSAVTAGNLSAFALIYVNVPDVADSTFVTNMSGYMRTDNIPVIQAGHDSTGTRTDSLASALGIVQSITQSASEPESLTPVTGFEDLQVVAGLDPDFATIVRQNAGDEGFFVTADTLHKGTALLLDASSRVAMFQAEAADTDFTDTSQTLGARFVFIGWTFNLDSSIKRDGAALMEAAIQWATSGASFSFPTSGNQFAIGRPGDLDRMVTYADSEVLFTVTTPASTTLTVQDSSDELATFGTISTSGDEINGFSVSDPTTGVVFIRFLLATTVSGSTPDVDDAKLRLDGQSPALRKISVAGALLHDPTVIGPDDWYTGGLLTWLTGLNKGISQEVGDWVASTRILTLKFPMPFVIAVADRFKVYPGDDKALATCRDKYSNVVNRRAEDYVPGNSYVVRRPLVP